jgi:hypothetical protein
LAIVFPGYQAIFEPPAAQYAMTAGAHDRQSLP